MKQYTFKINGNDYNVEINSVSGNIADVTVNGTPYKVEMENAPVQAVPVTAAAPSVVPQSAVPKTAAPQPAAPKAASSAKTITSPLPGVIIAVKVNVGEAVKAGQVVAILEAMKMENEIQAESDGTVTAVNVSKGDSVLEGAAIVTLG